MSTLELKKQLIKKINSIENVELLQEASRLIDIELVDIETPYVLSKEMDNAVNVAQEQINNGDYLTHENANKDTNKMIYSLILV